MAIASDIISHPSLNGLHEAVVLGAGAQSAAAIGVVRYQGQDDAGLKLLYFGNQQVQVGDIFVRPATLAGDEAEADGPYTWFGGPDSVRGAIKMRVVAAHEHTTVGEPFQNLAKMAVFLNGERATWLGPDLQDPWTAEAL